MLRAYLLEYFQTLVTPQQEELRLTLVDGFAGGGVYQAHHGMQRPPDRVATSCPPEESPPTRGESQGGNVTGASAGLGQGSEFTVRLPSEVITIGE